MDKTNSPDLKGMGCKKSHPTVYLLTHHKMLVMEIRKLLSCRKSVCGYPMHSWKYNGKLKNKCRDCCGRHDLPSKLWEYHQGTTLPSKIPTIPQRFCFWDQRCSRNIYLQEVWQPPWRDYKPGSIHREKGPAVDPHPTLLVSFFFAVSSARSSSVGGPSIVPCSKVSRSISLSSFMLWVNLLQGQRVGEMVRF